MHEILNAAKQLKQKHLQICFVNKTKSDRSDYLDGTGLEGFTLGKNPDIKTFLYMNTRAR